MQIKIYTRKFSLTKALRNYAKRRLNFSLATKDEYINKIEMRLSDINGPRGGKDKRCHLLIDLTGMPNIIVEDIQADMHNAIDRACDRASRVVVRKIGRQQKLLRQVMPFVFNDEALSS